MTEHERLALRLPWKASTPHGIQGIDGEPQGLGMPSNRDFIITAVNAYFPNQERIATLEQERDDLAGKVSYLESGAAYAQKKIAQLEAYIDAIGTGP